MDWIQAKDMLLTALLGVTATLIAVIGSSFNSELRQLVKSVQDLNIKIAEILTHLSSHTEKLNEHSERLEKLEVISSKKRR